VRGAHTGGVVQVLDRDRDAVERREFVAVDRGLGGLRFISRFVEGHREVRAELWVELLDATRVEIDELNRRDLLQADEFRELDGRCEREVGVVHCERVCSRPASPAS
jgi:hypothetical protein